MEEKVQRFETLLQTRDGKKSCTKHKLNSLIGQLQHATSIIKTRLLKANDCAGKTNQKAMAPYLHQCVV